MRCCDYYFFQMKRLRTRCKDLVYCYAKQHSEPAFDKRSVKVDELMLTRWSRSTTLSPTAYASPSALLRAGTERVVRNSVMACLSKSYYP
jgi:hypothetical protein